MKIAFIFSGQGAQCSGMGKELYDQFECVRNVFDLADKALGFSIKDICFNDDERINETEYTQPAILTMSMAMYALASEKGIKADYVAGLSLGEYSALTASGVFNFEDAVCLVRKRGRFMTEAVPKGQGAMSAVLNLDRDNIEKACEEASSESEKVWIANYNAPGQIVIAGNTVAVDKADKLVIEKGAKRVVRLNVSGPFHTILLKPASDRLNSELKCININDMNIPVATNLTGDLIKDKSEIIDILTKQVMNPVRWEETINKFISLGVDTFIELGPGKALCSFVKKISKNVKVFNIEDMKSLEKTCKGIDEKC